ncbi:hypothetical protein TcasGA2_TC004754 [Tribolium castaneum]|uniref:Uncharacterized protein n=1 Tax=Tribolium castaneum TaxID=7070 RepID=D6W7X4_TRICA|nr:hypothetical protein TcasGA2_TC004754 [Tribolium castaneum]
MTETPQLTYCDEEIEDILLLCYANYFGRYKQKHAPALVEIPNNTLIEHYFTHLQFKAGKKSKYKFYFRNGKMPPVPATFDMQGPRKIFQNRYVNLQKWKTLHNLTGADGPEHPIEALLATRERNLRVLSIANFFYFTNTIPTLNEIHEALEAYTKSKNRPIAKNASLFYLE